MRRTTLGAINNGNQNRPSVTGRERKSFGTAARPRPSYGAVGSGRPSTSGASGRGGGGRMSLAGSSRRSSQYGSDAGRSQVKDTRPLTDKGYQRQSIKTLIEFLVEHEYPNTVTLKMLSTPTNKCFIQIFQFLYAFVDNDQEVRAQIAKRPEEEVPRIFKLLRYPFNISKSQLLNVGSPHAWPMILGALTWLVDMIKFAFIMSTHTEDLLFGVKELENGETDFSGIFHRYLENSYEAFLNGAELNELGDYDEQLYQAVRAENEVVKQELEQLSAENVAFEEEYQRLSADSTRLDGLKQQRELLLSDKEKFQKYIDDLSNHKKMIMNQKAKVESEIEVARLENEATIKGLLELQEALSKQELSASDVEHLKREKIDLSKRLEALQKENQDLDQRIWDNEIAQAKINSQVEKVVAEYTDIARYLRMIPETAENALGMNLTLEFNPMSMTLSEPTRNIKASLLKVKTHVQSKIHQLESQNLNELDRLEEVNEQVADRTDEIAAVESKIRHTEKEMEQREEIFEAEYKKLVDQLEKSQKCVEDLKARAKSEKEETEQDLEDYKKKVEQRIAEMNQEKDDYRMFLLEACSIIINHKAKIQEGIFELKERTHQELLESQAREVARSRILDAEKV